MSRFHKGVEVYEMKEPGGVFVWYFGLGCAL